MTARLRAAIEECVVPWCCVPGDVDLGEGTLRRCMLCHAATAIVPAAADSVVVTHDPDCAFIAVLAAAEAAAPEPLDPERLARALTIAEWPPSIFPAGYGDPRWQCEFAEHLAAAYLDAP